MQVIRRPNSQENVSINLASTLGRGGEACVYTVPTDASLVAKVYHKPTVEQAHKLEVMIAHPPENPTANLGHISIAWPIELLRAGDGSDRIVGFLMPRIQGMRPSIDFYNPRTRRQNCPLFNYQYLVRAARNLAAAFAALHASGYCVGDVNESNILVSDTALVTVVDTDSFQVRDPNSNFIYRCPVGKPEFTPPELQNKTFAECERTVSHDLFGLAVLIFQFLMEGTHPFSGIFQGYGDPPAYEARIAQGHFTYSQKRRVPYIPTPISPPWEILHPSLQDLFVRSFEDGYNNPELRPTAQTWLAALTETENSLVGCSVNSQHRYSNHLHKCPWCERALQLGGRDPFLSIEAVAAREHLQLQPKQKKARTQTARDRVPKGRGASRTPQLASAFNNPRSKLVIPSQNISYYKPPKKPKFYPFIFCLIGFGLLGYLDLLIKFTSRPFIAQNSYAQQVIASNQDKDKNLSFADYYQQGHASYQVRDYEQAVEKFTKAIQKDPKYSKAYINRGNAHYNLKEYEAALADYNQAIRLNPNEVKAYENRGNARVLLAEYSSDPDKDYSLAIADFDNALRLNSNDAEAYVRRGVVRSQVAKYSGDSQQEYKKAIDDFNSALSINPNRAEAYFQRGIVRYQIAQYSSEFEREYKQAIDDFNRALHLNSQMAKAYLKRGIVRYELAQYGGNTSKQHYSKAVEDLQTSAKISLAQNDMENYQQALSSICVVLENKCDNFFQNASISSKGN